MQTIGMDNAGNGPRFVFHEAPARHPSQRHLASWGTGSRPPEEPSGAAYRATFPWHGHRPNKTQKPQRL